MSEAAEGCTWQCAYKGGLGTHLVVHAKQGWHRGADVAKGVLAGDLVHNCLHLLATTCSRITLRPQFRLLLPGNSSAQRHLCKFSCAGSIQLRMLPFCCQIFVGTLGSPNYLELLLWLDNTVPLEGYRCMSECRSHNWQMHACRLEQCCGEVHLQEVIAEGSLVVTWDLCCDLCTIPAQHSTEHITSSHSCSGF